MSNFTPNQQKREQVRRRLIFDDEPDQQSPKPYTSSKVDNGAKSPDKFDSASSEKTPNTFKITDLSQMTEEHRLEQMTRWNFDFENEIPLTGDWEWERVTPVAPSVNHKEKICALDKKETNGSDRNV